MRNYASLYSSLLADLGFSSCPDTHIFTDMDVRAASRVQLANSFYKKLRPLGHSNTADVAALEKFKAINLAVCDNFEFVASNEAESCFYDYFRHHLNVCLNPHESIESFDLDSIRKYMSVGPGAAQKADSRTMVTKLFDGEMTVANYDLIPYYRAALVETGLWCDAERRRHERFGFTKVRGNKLFFAPKNAEISRVCGTEANLNMLIQKAVGEFLEFRLAWYFGINLSTQPTNNQELARKGSIDGSIGTIDLVSASDCIGASFLSKCLEPSFVKSMIFASRSEGSILPDGTFMKLKMVSTMGNGFTFPLQTIIFASVVRACYQLMELPSDCPRTQFGVFGDDICVRCEAYEFVCRMLAKLGFTVNVRKSFNSGPFRESCGSDYVAGSDTRGVYVTSLETPQHVYSTINRLARWSSLHGIPLPATFKLLMSWARDIRVPFSESDDAGICVPFKLTIPKLNSSYWFKYRAYVKRKNAYPCGEPDEPDPSKAPFNPEGVAVGYLSGHYRRRDVALTEPDDSAWKHDWSASASIRDRAGVRARYQIVSKCIPYWDYWPATKLAADPGQEYTRRIDLTIYNQGAWESTMVALLDTVE